MPDCCDSTITLSCAPRGSDLEHPLVFFISVQMSALDGDLGVGVTYAGYLEKKGNMRWMSRYFEVGPCRYFPGY